MTQIILHFYKMRRKAYQIAKNLLKQLKTHKKVYKILNYNKAYNQMYFQMMNRKMKPMKKKNYNKTKAMMSLNNL